MKAVLIKPVTPLHLGEATVALERTSDLIHADTLFGAICHAWGCLYGKKDTDGMIGEFLERRPEETPPFLISSCFPFKKGAGSERQNVYYLPSPINLTDSFSRQNKRIAKRSRYMTHLTYGKWLKGELGDDDIEGLENDRKALAAGMGSNANIHVSLDRMTLAANPYYVSRLHCAEEWGFYFFYKCRGDYEEKFRKVVGALEDMGLGGERSSGCGAFRAEFVELPLEGLEEAGGSGAWMNVSLVFPGAEDLKKLNGAQIRLRERKGWASSPFTNASYRRKRLLMIEEGSVFKDRVEGCLADVTPAIWDRGLHPIYRYGLAWLVRARWG